MVYGGCTGYALRRGDLHSGTLRDGNHKPTIPSTGERDLPSSGNYKNEQWFDRIQFNITGREE